MAAVHTSAELRRRQIKRRRRRQIGQLVTTSFLWMTIAMLVGWLLLAGIIGLLGVQA